MIPSMILKKKIIFSIIHRRKLKFSIFQIRLLFFLSTLRGCAGEGKLFGDCEEGSFRGKK